MEETDQRSAALHQMTELVREAFEEADWSTTGTVEEVAEYLLPRVRLRTDNRPDSGERGKVDWSTRIVEDAVRITIGNQSFDVQVHRGTEESDEAHDYHLVWMQDQITYALNRLTDRPSSTEAGERKHPDNRGWTADNWIEWAHEVGKKLDPLIPFWGVDNRDRIERAVDMLTAARPDPSASSEWGCSSEFAYGHDRLRCQAKAGHPRRHRADVVVSEPSGGRTTIWWGDEEAIDAAPTESELDEEDTYTADALYNLLHDEVEYAARERRVSPDRIRAVVELWIDRWARWLAKKDVAGLRAGRGQGADPTVEEDLSQVFECAKHGFMTIVGNGRREPHEVADELVEHLWEMVRIHTPYGQPTDSGGSDADE